MCLRLHRPFRREAEDPVHLDDAAAVLQLHEFVENPTCPVWLKKRYAKHNRLSSKKKNAVEDGVGMALRPAETASGVALRPTGLVRAAGSSLGDASSTASNVVSAQNVGVALRPADAAPAQVPGVALRPTGSNSSAKKVINLSGPRDSWPEPSDDEEPVPAVQNNSKHFLADTTPNRQTIACQHGLLWGSIVGDSRYSIRDAIRHHRPPLKLACVKEYLAALQDGKTPAGRQVHALVEQFVFLVLFIDLQAYARRGSGVYKPCLSKQKLTRLAEAFFKTRGTSVTGKEKRSVVMKPYAELWEFVKLETLKQCGLAVSSSPSRRVGFQGQPANTQSALREGTWRQQIFCLDPHTLEHEEWEDAAEREAKRIRYVQAAMHEQSMGRPGKKEYEVSLPVDADALTCADFDTRAEWDALHPYVQYVSTQWLSAEVAEKLLPETNAYVLKPSQGGLGHVEAEQLTEAAGMSLRTAGPTANNPAAGMSLRTAEPTPNGPALDPTQASFVQHMSTWKDAYKSDLVAFKSNLPMPQQPDDPKYLTEPVLLLGTAGTGKTTTLQASNSLLEADGLAGRIVRCAYTGVAASNMGMGGRTLVSLFRLSRRGFGGGLEPLSQEDILNMDQELKGMCLLEIDEVSMLEKLVLAHVHARLQQWRLEVYHEKHCRSKKACLCGARLPFGGVKVVLAGDFGQLPPVAVTPERTLLNAKAKAAGQDRHEVNLGLRLFQAIRVVFRLRRIHRQVGQSAYKESLLRLRDAAHTKEDVALWKTHDLTDVSACTLSVEERKLFEQEGVHLFCENRRAGQFNGRRLGEDAATSTNGTILRLWSVDSTPGVERYTCDNYGGLRRVLHVAIGAPVMLTMNLRTVWNLVNGARGHIVAVLPSLEHVASASAAVAGALGQQQHNTSDEVGGVSVVAAQYVVVDFPSYVGPIMISGHPTWVAVPKQTCRHEKFRGLARTNFPLVLCYGMTVHKSQGLTVSTRCVFNMEHEPTWSPFKHMCGLAFVGFSRVTDFAKMAFKNVPDYWTFQSMVDTDMFRWRSDLERRLDDLHDQTAKIVFHGKSSTKDDVQRHQAWTENLTGSKMSEEALADLTHMLSVRGVLPQPGYKDKPVRGFANKAGGGRNKRKTMRGTDAASSALKEPDPEEEEVALEADLIAEQRQRFEQEMGFVEPDPDHNSEEEDEIRRRHFGFEEEDEIRRRHFGF